MKISFNSAIKNNQTYFSKPSKSNTTQPQSKINLNGLNCIGNYNLAFGTRAVYVVNYDGSYEKFDSARDMTKKLNISNANHILSGKNSASGDRTFVYADELEKPDGKIDQKILKRVILNFKNANNQPIYAIDFYGNIQKFDNMAIASQALNINRAQIINILNGTRQTTINYTFVKAFDVEIRDKNGLLIKSKGKPIIDTELINKEREKFLYRGHNFPVASIDKEGNIRQYKDMNEAALQLNCKRQNIFQALNELKTTRGKYTFVRLSDIVQFDKFGNVAYDKDNNYAINYDKVEEFRQLVFKK